MQAKVDIVFTLDEIRDLYPDAYERAVSNVQERLAEWYDPHETTDYAQGWLDELIGKGLIKIASWEMGRGRSVDLDGDLNPGAVRSDLTALLAQYPQWEGVADLLAAMPPVVTWDTEEWVLSVRPHRGWGTGGWDADDLAQWYLDDDNAAEIAARQDAWIRWGETLGHAVLDLIEADYEYADSEERAIDFIEANDVHFTREGGIA